MQQFSISPLEPAASIWRNRGLVLALTRREIAGRYRGSFIGVLWSFVHPVFMLVIYTFVFSVVFQARWGEGGGSKAEFALILFAGLLVFNLFSECCNRAPGLVLSNTSYVKKIVFPLEVLPWVILGAALFHAMAGLGVWLLFHLMLLGPPPATVLLFPLTLLPLVLLTMGLSWMFASLGVYFRDVSQVVGIVTTALLFLSAVFFPVSALPTEYRPLLMVNPLVVFIEQSRGVLIWGLLPDWTVYGSHLLFSLLVAWLGFAWFQKTRRGFADVL
jgi:lipopolysaccharide transport system permease protein